MILCRWISVPRYFRISLKIQLTETVLLLLLSQEINLSSVCWVPHPPVANPNIILNTAVAEALHQFSEQLKEVPADRMETAVHNLLKETVTEHKRIIFNGNGYTDEWLKGSRRPRTL